ncbi:hypothetical protein TIFTF001_039592 [Ficus carica]|uniref:Uncharacterized protein n=1 Tax=Ficus carica TaxID=3494 RepID=A0AA88JFB0_FICCA|nr:hypothetical protein TIFTF001_039592 [Ficus carica]
MSMIATFVAIITRDRSRTSATTVTRDLSIAVVKIVTVFGTPNFFRHLRLTPPAGVVPRRSEYTVKVRRDKGDERAMRSLLGMEVTAELGGMCFSEIEEGKGHGFDGTFRLSTLAMTVIFLPVAFPILVDFHFVLVNLCIDLDLGDLLVLLDLWLCREFSDLYDLRSWLPIDRQFPSGWGFVKQSLVHVCFWRVEVLSCFRASDLCRFHCASVVYTDG